MTTYVQRPWVSYFAQLPYSESKLEQQCKLVRNQIASMDLGNPHFHLIDSRKNKDGSLRLPAPSPRELYLEWVADWKRSYRELSECIRTLKRQRTPAGFSAAEAEILRVNEQWGNYDREGLRDVNNGRILRTHEALRKCAQVMLNARYVGKLASAELRRRAWEAKQKLEGPVVEG